MIGDALVAEPENACTSLRNEGDLSGKIVVVRRGDCMFVEKAKIIEERGSIGMVVVGS